MYFCGFPLCRGLAGHSSPEDRVRAETTPGTGALSVCCPRARGNQVLGMFGGFRDTSGRWEKPADEELRFLLFYALLACL